MTLHLRKHDHVRDQSKEVTFSHPLCYIYISHFALSSIEQTVGQMKADKRNIKE